MRQEITAIITTGLLLGSFAGCSPIHERSAKPAYDVGKCEELLLSNKEFEMRETLTAWGTQFNIYTGGRMVGVIKEDVTSWGAHYDIFAGKEERKIGSIDQRLMTWGLNSDVFDASGTRIGYLKEEILHLNRTIDLQDANRQTLLQSKVRFLSMTHTVDINGPSGHPQYGEAKKNWAFHNYALNLSPSAPRVDNRLLFGLVAIEDALVREDDDDDSESDSDDD